MLMGQLGVVAMLLLAHSLWVLVEHLLYEREQLSLLAGRGLRGVKSCKRVGSYT